LYALSRGLLAALIKVAMQHIRLHLFNLLQGQQRSEELRGLEQEDQGRVTTACRKYMRRWKVASITSTYGAGSE